MDAQSLELQLAIDPSWNVRVVAEAAGEALVRIRPPFAAQDPALSGFPADPGLAVQIGQRLFQAVFTEQIFSLYNLSRLVARERGSRRLRIRLQLTGEGEGAAPGAGFPLPEDLPWELLYDPREGFVALLPDISLVRFYPALSSLGAPLPPPGSGPLSVLLVLSDSGDPWQSSLMNRLSQAQGEQFQVEVLERATIGEFEHRLRSDRYQAIHFAGVAADAAGGSLLVSEAWTRALALDELGLILRDLRQLRLVWLDGRSETGEQRPAGTFARSAARFVALGLPAAVAVPARGDPRTAVWLCEAFYRGLAEGLPVDWALAQARTGSERDLRSGGRGSLDWAAPRLFTRVSDDLLLVSHDGRDAALGATPESYIQPMSDHTGQMVISGDVRGSNVVIGDVLGGDLSFGVAKGSAPPDLSIGRRRRLEERMEDLLQRKQRFELQRMQKSVDPSVPVEIERLDAEIQRLSEHIQKLS